MQINQQQLIKDILAGVGKLIDARAKTTEINLRAEFKSEIRASEKRIKSEFKSEIKESKTELKAEIRDTKTDVKTDIKAIGHGLTDVKADLKALRSGVAKKLVEQDERLEAVEKATGTSSKH